MFKFFDMLTGFIEIIVQQVIDLLKQIVYFFTFITQGSLYLGSVIAVLPAFIAVFCSAVLGFALFRAVIDLLRGN